MKLFLKECKNISTSIVYYAFIILIIISWYTNFSGVTSEEINVANGENTNNIQLSRSLLQKPSKEDSFFGTKREEDPDKIMVGAVDTMVREYSNNIYATYPLGYYKAEKLSSDEQTKVMNILEEITGLKKEQIENLPEGYFPSVNGNIFHVTDNMITGEKGEIVIAADGENVDIDNVENESIDGNNTKEKNVEEQDKTKKFVSQVTYERFKELMLEMENIVGKGSNYSMKTLLTYFGTTEMNYEEALKEYDITIKEDKVTRAFARLFCDYMGLALGLYPVFLAIIFWLKDRHANMQEMIYSRKISSKKLVITRYFAAVTMMLLPIFLLSLESLIPLVEYSIKSNITIDYFAYFTYIIWWLLPVVMIVYALGMLLTVLTDSPLAIIIQLLWWFIDKGIGGLSGDTKWYTLMIRHNSLNDKELIEEDFGIIMQNRIMYLLLSIVCIVLTVYIIDKKRRGKINAWQYYSKIFQNIKGKLSSYNKN